jgi:hypothetical protein
LQMEGKKREHQTNNNKIEKWCGHQWKRKKDIRNKEKPIFILEFWKENELPLSNHELLDIPMRLQRNLQKNS